MRPIQVKGERVPIHVLSNVEETIENSLKDGHFVKLDKCTKDCLILPTLVTAQRDGYVKLALNSKLINKQNYRNRYQMPNMNELVDYVALVISGNTNAPIWFSNIDLKYA